MGKTYDRAEIMKDAHKRFAQGKRIGMGWTFSQCLKTAWAAARQRKEEVRQYYQPTPRGPRTPRDRPFPIMPGAPSPRDIIHL